MTLKGEEGTARTLNSFTNGLYNLGFSLDLRIVGVASFAAMQNPNTTSIADQVGEGTPSISSDRTILVSQEDYARRTRRVHTECEDWMEGFIRVDEFDPERFGLWEPYECMSDGSFLDRDHVHNLTMEFEFVLELSRAIIGASEIIIGHEHDDDVSPLSRAFYFASEAAFLGITFDDYFPGKLVHSCASPPKPSLPAPTINRVYGDTQLRLFV